MVSKASLPMILFVAKSLSRMLGDLKFQRFENLKAYPNKFTPYYYLDHMAYWDKFRKELREVTKIS